MNARHRMRSGLFVVALLLAGPVVAAQAHSFPDSQSPPAGSTLDTSPRAVVIHFTEDLEPQFTSLRVLDQGGKPVDAGDHQVSAADPKRLSVSLPKLPPGIYKVVWHATSVDTHKTQGSYTFTVKP